MNDNRALPHNGREVFIQHDHDFYSAVIYKGDNAGFTYFLKEGDTFIELSIGRWYAAVALQMIEKSIKDHSLITKELVASYWWAIREGFNKQYDKNLKAQYDNPRHKKDLAGIRRYIAKIEAAHKEAMKRLKNELYSKE